MQWNDRVYGEVAIDDPKLIELIESPTFQRLKGIKQAGPSAFAFPFKNVTRFEHSLGVHLLLGKLGADLKEQVAGLLHDLSHTAFSHAVDFVITTDQQDHHESLKPIFLAKPDIIAGIRALGFEPGDFLDDARYPLLERPLPALCADRIDYFLRDGIACGVLTPADASRFLGDLGVDDGRIVFKHRAIADEAIAKFAEMNRDWWASDTESYIYNTFADALREGFRIGCLTRTDLFEDDQYVLNKLLSSQSTLIHEKLAALKEFRPEKLVGFVPKVSPKVRWIEPPVRETADSISE